MNSDPKININLPAWIGLAVVLVGTAQFDATAKLAAAFAYLILVAVLMSDGLTAAAAIKQFISGQTTVQQTQNQRER